MKTATHRYNLFTSLCHNIYNFFLRTDGHRFVTVTFEGMVCGDGGHTTPPEVMNVLSLSWWALDGAAAATSLLPLLVATPPDMAEAIAGGADVAGAVAAGVGAALADEDEEEEGEGEGEGEPVEVSGDTRDERPTILAVWRTALPTLSSKDPGGVTRPGERRR